MSTKSLLLSVVAAITFSSAWGQVNVNPAISAKLDAYIRHSNANQWEEAFELVYPKLFTRIPKDQILTQTKNASGSGMSLFVSNTEITSSSVPVEEGHETFVRIEYVSDIVMTIEPNGMFDAPKAIQAMEEQMKATYGNPNVRYNADEKKFNIRAHKVMMAIDGGDGDWKLVDINMDQPDLMEFLFSPSIMDALVRVE
jgi:hypothetical protein